MLSTSCHLPFSDTFIHKTQGIACPILRNGRINVLTIFLSSQRRNLNAMTHFAQCDNFWGLSGLQGTVSLLLQDMVRAEASILVMCCRFVLDIIALTVYRRKHPPTPVLSKFCSLRCPPILSHFSPVSRTVVVWMCVSLQNVYAAAQTSHDSAQCRPFPAYASLLKNFQNSSSLLKDPQSRPLSPAISPGALICSWDSCRAFCIPREGAAGLLQVRLLRLTWAIACSCQSGCILC